MEQLYLEQLIVKPMPKKQGKFLVKFKEIHQPSEEVTNEVPEIAKVKIVDKRNEMKIDRQMVLDRLKNKNVFNIRKQEPVQKVPIIGDEIIKISVKKPTKIKENIIIEQEKQAVEAELEEKAEAELEEKAEAAEAELEEKVEAVEAAETELEEKAEAVEAEKEALQKEKRNRKKKLIAPSRIFIPKINEEIKNKKIGKHTVEERLPKPEKIVIKTSPYYMNNRRIFIQKMREMFKDYTKDLESSNGSISCSSNKSDSTSLMTHQKIVRDYLNLYTPYRGLLIYHGLGSGKCLKKGTPVMMSNGEIKNVENIKEGDSLMGDDSKPRNVLSLARGRDKMYDIIPKIGEKYTVNQEHILCLRVSDFPKMNNHSNNYTIQWIENNEFCSKMFIFNENNENFIKLDAEMFYQKILNSTKTSDNVLEIAVKDYLKLSKQKKALLKGYKLPIDFAEKELSNDPYNMGNWLVNNANNIPMEYKCNSRENRLKLLAGILDSAANVKKKGFEIIQNNETLIDDIMFLARSLGYSCYTTIKKDSLLKLYINGNDLHKIPMQNPTKKVIINKEVNQKNCLETEIKVVCVGEDEYYGFMIDENCRFMLGDFTVTHNTATSIAIAEGMKSSKSVMIMTPAALKMNYFSEIKKYGDPLYRKNQYWEFITVDGKPEYIDILENALSIPRETFLKNRGAWMVDVTKPPNFSELSSVDQESIDDQLNLMIRSKYIDINYNGLTKNKINALTEDDTKNPFDDKVVIIDEAHNFVSRIVNKIKKPNSNSFKLYDYLMKAKNARIVLLTGTPIINYPNEIGILFNILRGSIKTWIFPITVKTGEKINKEEILKIFDKESFRHYDYVEYSDNKLIITRNPFGFMNTKKRGPVAKKGGTINTLITSLLNGGKTKKKRENKASKSKGTKKQRQDISNEPYSMKNGVIKINYRHEEEIEDDARVDILDRVAPQYHKGGEGEFEKYNGVKLEESGALNDDDFVKEVKRILKKYKLEIIEGLIDVKYYKSLPDDAESFLSMFVDIDTGSMTNENLFKKRILGLTSYFRSAQEKLLPRFVLNDEIVDVDENEKKTLTSNKNIHLVPIEMSENQFANYVKIRTMEIDQEKENRKNKKKAANKEGEDDLYKISSTYRIFSRAACNFSFPPEIIRPHPEKKTDELTENDLDNVDKNILIETDAYLDEDDLVNQNDVEELNYKKRIDNALAKLAESDYLLKDNLQKYSPKFVKLLENIQNDENKGLHLIYSQFRTIEGIGILKLILEANGYSEFKIKKNISTDKWELIEKEGEEGKSKFVLYTGTENAEEKEVIRNIYNSNWGIVPPEIVEKIQQKSSNNYYGEIIKIFMITSSGAEGINLKNTRFVHIVEPYWHNVRVEQVVGRARRICSHEDLPDELRTVKVYLYVTVFSEIQKTDKKTIEIMLHDVSRINGRSITTDESLYEMSQIKEGINKQILKSIKETAIDCNVYNTKKLKGNDDEELICYGSNFGKLESNDFISYPTLEKDASEKEELNVKQQKIKLKDTKEINGVKYKIDPATNTLYDAEIFENTKQLVKVGELKKVGKKMLVELL